MNENLQMEFETRRANFVKPFAGDKVISETIPDIVAELFKREFGITIDDHRHVVPIVFSTAWKHILRYMGSQQLPEFMVNVGGGVQIEYITEYSESDKPTNIIPRMKHTGIPIFKSKEIQVGSAAESNQSILNSYNEWRSVNLTEVLDKVENETENEVRNTFAIYLMHAAAVTPMIAATYAAGVQLAIETKKTINMYGYFEIDCYNDEITLTPLAAIKQGLKNDGKK
jgi:hypothetical protein